MRAAIITLVSAVATIGIAACAQSGEAAPEPAVQVDSTAHLGPAIGESVSFAVRDAAGVEARLADIRGENGVVLVFHRSADWCPACQDQLTGLGRIEDDLAERGYNIAAISIDAPEALAEFAGRSGVGFTLLSDEGGRTIAGFGLADPVFSETSFAAGAARPAAIVIDADGRVRATLVGGDYRRPPAASAILAAVEQLGA